MLEASTYILTSRRAEARRPYCLQNTVQLPQSDAIIIKANIRGAEVRRLLVDNRSSCDIFFLEGKNGDRPKES